MMTRVLLRTAASIGMAIVLATQVAVAAEPKQPPAQKGSVEKRDASAARQAAQDVNAKQAAPGGMSGRALFKSSKNYRNASWDLVDAVKDGKIKLADLKKNELPAQMQKLTAEQQKRYIVEKTTLRIAVQKEILELSEARSKYVAAERKKIAATQPSTLDRAMSAAVKEQVSRKNKSGR